jgi:hypothetical protein
MIAKTFPFPKTFLLQTLKTLRPAKTLRDHVARPGASGPRYRTRRMKE